MSKELNTGEAQEPKVVIPDINKLPERPFLQSLASPKSWVRVTLYTVDGPTKAEIDRPIETLILIRNGWGE